MFRKIQIRLSLLCCLFTELLVLAVVFCCLKISEKSMYGQEEAYFMLKAGNISHELHSEAPVTINWYMRNVNPEKNILYLEVDGVPSTLSQVVLTEPERGLAEEVQLCMQENEISPVTGKFTSDMEYFRYEKEKPGCLVLYGCVQDQSPRITWLYLYSLESFYQRVNRQRLRFLAVWLLSIPLVYGFSCGFTSHVLKPVVQNQEQQKDFIAFASHELRSPLAVFKTGLSMLKNRPDEDRQQRIFALMGNEMSRMERLIQDLLCLAKVERAELNFQFEPVNLAELVESVYEKYKEIAEKKEIILSCSRKEGQDYHCVCDWRRVEQVLVILLENALYYTPSGKNVSLNLYRQRGRCYIQVADTGKGIPAEEKEKIFDKFYQVSSSRSDKEHFGLGLSIAGEICSSHGGKISVSDTEGGGSTFTVRLPVKK